MSKNYVELKVSDLRDECKNRGLDTSGLKVHLVERLNKFDREQMFKSKTEVRPNMGSTNESVKDDLTASQSEYDVNNEVSNSTNMDCNSTKSLTVDDKITSKDDRKRPYQPEVSNSSEMKKENLFNLASYEMDNWENRKDVHLDFYNSDMNLVIDEEGYSGIPLYENGFEYMCAGVKGNYGFKSGKIFYEVKVLKKLKVELNSDAGESNFIRVGWSTDNESLALGEGTHSYGYDGVGKKTNNGNLIDYGCKIDEGNVIGCFLEFNADSFIIRYSVDGVNQGEAFKVLTRDLKDHVLIPHIYTKNISFAVNFGQNDNGPFFQPTTDKSIEDKTWTFVAKINLSQRLRSLMPPKSKSECEVLMMCGLPSCGKTNWTEKQTNEHSNKRFNVLSVNTVLEKMKVINLRKKVSSSSWDSFISFATHCLNKLMEIAVSKRRNFILDQTNVYPSAQRRRMKPFEEFIRKAIIIVPTDDEYQRRMNQVIQEEGKDVPESAVLQLKENFVIPEENSDLFNEIIFIELQRFEAEELIKKYNEEAKNLKKKDTNTDAKSKREVDDESFGKWANSPKDTSEDSEPTAPKKSRWNDQMENRKESKPSRDRHERASPERLPRKNDYKGGFCFSREASDSGKGSNRSSESGFRSDDRHNDKFRDQRSDRSSNRSSTVQNRKSDDRKPKFDRDDSKFGSRSAMGGGGSRDSRPRDRGTESRGGNQFQGSRGDSRPRGGGAYNDRRQGNSYDSGSSGEARNKFPQSGGSGGSYNDRSGMNTTQHYSNQDSRSSSGSNRFQQAAPERNDFRGGRGGRGGGTLQTGGHQNTSFSERRAIPDNRAYQNYSEFNPYHDGDNSRQVANAPWEQQQDYNDGMDSSRRGSGFDNIPSSNINRGGYDQQQQMQQQQQQYGGNPRGAVGAPLSRGKSTENKGMMQSNQQPYNERKTAGMTGGNAARGGGQSNRGGGRSMGGPHMDSSQFDDYSYGSSSGPSASVNKGYDAPISRFGNSNTGAYQQDSSASAGGYKDYNKEPMMSYSSAKAPSRGGYSKFADKPSSYDTKSDYSGSMMQMGSSDASGAPYDSYQSPYESASYGGSQQQQQQNNSGNTANQQSGGGYYNYYTGSGGGDLSSSGGGKVHSMGNPASSYSSAASSANRSTAASSYQSMYPSSAASTGGHHRPTSGGGGGYQYPSSINSNSNSMSGSTGGYQQQSGNYQSSAAAATGGYQSSYMTGGSGSNTGTSGSTGGGGNYQSSSSYHQQSQGGNPASGGYQQSSYQSANAANTGSSGGSNYTNPYNAIYESTGDYNSSYYGQTNTYAQSGSYGDNTVNSKFSDYSSKPPAASTATDRAILPSTGTNLPAQQSGSIGQQQQAQASWGTGYGDYSQYYGQYYGN